MTRPFSQERDRVAAVRIGRVAVVSLIVGVAGVAVSDLLFRAYPDEGPQQRVAPAEIGVAEQSLVETNARGLAEQRRQRESLEHYRWVDKTHGIAEIPVDRAMRIVAERGR